MADIKTNLRELSVVLGIKGYDINLIRTLNPQTFLEFINDNLSNDIRRYDNFSHLKSFNSELLSIIHNGIMLGKAIVDNKLVDPTQAVQWTGCKW